MSTTPESLMTAEREAEAAALAAAGSAENGRRQAEEMCRQDAELLRLMQRRQAAEELAAQQAQARAAAEAEAEALAAERAHAERMLERAVRLRVEAEERALADAKRREMAAHDLAAAAAARAKREQEAEALAKERAASERRAAELAAEKIKAEQAAEAAALARIGAEQDAAYQSERRSAQEAAAWQAEKSRREVEQGHLADTADSTGRKPVPDPFPLRVQLPSKPALPAASVGDDAAARGGRSGLYVGIAAAVGVVCGVLLGAWLLPAPGGAGKPLVAGKPGEPGMRLDYQLNIAAPGSGRTGGREPARP